MLMRKKIRCQIIKNYIHFKQYNNANHFKIHFKSSDREQHLDRANILVVQAYVNSQ